MLPLRTARRHVRVASSAAVTAACELISSDQVALPILDWGSLPQGVLLGVVSQPRGSYVALTAVLTCKIWRGGMAELVSQATLSQLPPSTPAVDAAHRKLL